MMMYHLGQLKRTAESVEQYWHDAQDDLPILCEELVNQLPDLRASPGKLIQVGSVATTPVVGPKAAL